MIKFVWIVYGKLLTEQISIMTLSSTLKNKGIDPILIYSNSQKDILRKIDYLKPQVIGYSLMYGSHWRYIGLSKIIRERFPDIFQIVGGPLATFYPETINQLAVDATAIGEADISLPNLLNKLGNGKAIEDTKGMHFKIGDRIKINELENLLEDLDTLPFPDRDIFYQQDSLLRNQEFKSFMSGRGCPYPCTYCFNHRFNEMFMGRGKIIRKKSVDYFINEIKEVKDRFGCQFAIFEDDIFVLNLAWLEKFVRKFKKMVNIPYACYVRADLLNKDVLKLLKESGCYIVRMAIETGNEEMRNTILKRNMKNETIIKAADLIHRYGLKLSVSNMLGLPMETVACVDDTINLNIRCHPEHPSSQFFMPYPNMELTRIAMDKGYFTKEMFAKIPKNTWKFTPLSFDKQTKKAIEKTQKLFSLFVRFPSTLKFKKLFFLLPDEFLYFLSVVVKIAIVKNYFPPTQVSLRQRVGVLLRFFSFYA